MDLILTHVRLWSVLSQICVTFRTLVVHDIARVQAVRDQTAAKKTSSLKYTKQKLYFKQFILTMDN